MVRQAIEPSGRENIESAVLGSLTRSKRIDWIDYAKGLGIALVVYGHVVRGLADSDLPLSPTFFKIFDSLVYGFHMPLFFLLSGIFAEKWASKNKPADAVRSKVSTILLPYAIWSLIQGGINVFLSDFTNYGMTWSQVLSGTAYAPFAQFWFLYVLFMHFMMYVVLRRFVLTQYVFILSLILYAIYPMCHFWILGRIFANFIFFACGAFIGSTRSTEHLQKNLNVWSWVVIAAAFLTLNAAVIIKGFDHYLYLPLVAAAGIILFCSISYALSNRGYCRWIQSMGALSLHIYLLHIFFTAGARIGLTKIFQVTDLYTHAVLGVLAGIILPILCAKAASKLGINSFLFGR